MVASPAYGDEATPQLIKSDLKKEIDARTDRFNNKVGFQNVELPVVIATIVQALMSLLAILFMGLIFYGGYVWMMARGNEQEVERGRGIIRHAIIGLAVTLSSYAIGYFVLYWLSTAGTGQGAPTGI